jgi:hypothetical protein
MPETAFGSGADEGSWAFYGAEATLLADLEAEFGPERFAAFWTAEAPVAEAFEAAFGLSRADWTHTWAVERLGTRRARGSLLADVPLTLLLCTVLGLVAGARVRRREVG